MGIIGEDTCGNDEVEVRKQEIQFLKSAQAGDLDQLKNMKDLRPQLLNSRSTSKGYTAMHYAAMAGKIPIIEWLFQQGLSVEEESHDATTPLAVALQYKRLEAARRLQQLRDTSRRRGAAAPPPGLPSDPQGAMSPLVGTAWKSDTPQGQRPQAQNIVLQKMSAASAKVHGESCHRSSTLNMACDTGTAAAATVSKAEAASGYTSPSPVPRVEDADAQSNVASPLDKPSLFTDVPRADGAQIGLETRRTAAATPATAPAKAGSAQYGLSLDIANREAAQQALAAGQHAMASGNIQRGVRLLQKAKSLQPSDSTINAACQEAEQELQAILKEQREEAEELKRARAARGGTPAAADETRGGSGVDKPAAYARFASRLASMAGGALFALLGLLISVVAVFGRSCGAARLFSAAFSLASTIWEHAVSSIRPETERQEARAYLFYYWRAYLRMLLRIGGVLVVLVLAWFFPTLARATLIVSCSALAVWAVPFTQLGDDVPRPVAALLISIAWLLVWLLPSICLLLLVIVTARQCVLVGSAVMIRGEEFAPYTNSTFSIGIATVLYAFCYYPSALLGLLGLLVWFGFLFVLPKLCIGLTEFVITVYLYEFRSICIHLALLGVLFTYETPSLLLPLGLFLVLFWFFPRIVGAIIGSFLAWLLWPPLRRLRADFAAVLVHPYGTGEPPEKVKDGESAVSHVLAACDHYEALNSYRGASPKELKASYKRMALLLHPDKNHAEDAAVAFKRMNDAWDVVGDVMRRAEYDAEADSAAGEEGDGENDADGGSGTMRKASQEGPPGLKKRRARAGPRRR